MYRNYSEKAPGALCGVQQEKKRKKTIRIKVKRNKRSANLLLLKIGGSQRQYWGKNGVDSRLTSPQLLDLRTVLLQQLSPRVSSSLEATQSLRPLLQARKVHQLHCQQEKYYQILTNSKDFHRYFINVNILNLLFEDAPWYLRYWKMESQSRIGNAGHQNRIRREGQAHLGQHMLSLL